MEVFKIIKGIITNHPHVQIMIMVIIITSNMRSSMCRSGRSGGSEAWPPAPPRQTLTQALLDFLLCYCCHTSCTCQVQLYLILYYTVFLETKSHISSTCQVQLYLVFYYAIAVTQALLAKYSSSWFSLNLTVSHKLYLLVLYFLQQPQAILGFPHLLVVSNSNCTR